MAKKKKSKKSSSKSSSDDEISRSSSRSSGHKYRKSDRYSPDDDDNFLRSSLEKEGLTIVDMTADGNCLFRSLSDQLFGDYGNLHDEIRSRICDYMEENGDDFKLFLVLDDDDCEEGDDAKDFESYISTMREDGEWGGNLELVAAARLYRRRITVYSAAMSAYTIEFDGKSIGPDLLVSFHDNDHYNSVRDDKAPPKPITSRRIKQSKSKHDYPVLCEEEKDNDGLETDTSTRTDTATISSSQSDRYLPEKVQEPIHRETPKKPLKKSSPCPCGSGLRYRQCCAKEKNGSKTRKMKGSSHGREPPGEKIESKEMAMKGNFRMLSI